MYSQRAVFFLDILGFASKVEKSVEDSELLKKICACLRKIESYANFNDIAQEHPDFGELDFMDKKAHPGPRNLRYPIESKKNRGVFPIKRDELSSSSTKLQILTFSDSIVASVSCEHIAAPLLLIQLVQKIQYELLNVGILTRGGGDIGSLIHEESGVMFGPAFNNAYRIESTIANMPRVLVSQGYIDFLCRHFPDEYVKDLFLYKYKDGLFGVDSYKWVEQSVDIHDKFYPVEFIGHALNNVSREMDVNRSNARVHSKLMWHKEMILSRLNEADGVRCEG